MLCAIFTLRIVTNLLVKQSGSIEGREKKRSRSSAGVFEKRLRLYRGLLKVLRFVLLSNVRGPFVSAFFAAEEINSLIRVENLKEVALRK
jgi:hypothetical protein